jgi:hypothetical protein
MCPRALGHTVAALFVFVFCAKDDERIAFSLMRNGANLPPSSECAPWLPALRTNFNVPALALFNVDAAMVSRALQREGYYIGNFLFTQSWWSLLVC